MYGNLAGDGPLGLGRPSCMGKLLAYIYMFCFFGVVCFCIAVAFL